MTVTSLDVICGWGCSPVLSPAKKLCYFHLPHHREVSISSTVFLSQVRRGPVHDLSTPSTQASSLSCVSQFCPRPSAPTRAVILTTHSNHVRVSVCLDWSLP